MLMKKNKTIFQYQQVDGKRWPNFQKLALKVYSMAASSAPAERNFSTYVFVLSKFRNTGSKEYNCGFLRQNYKGIKKNPINFNV